MYKTHLTVEQLNKLTTPRLLAYYRKHCNFESIYWDDKAEGCTQFEYAKICKDILATREHLSNRLRKK